MSSFVQKQATKQWSWLALEATTRPIIAFDVGERSHTRAEPLGAKMPPASRQHATFDTDHHVIYCHDTLTRAAA